MLKNRGSWLAKVRSEPQLAGGAPSIPDGLSEVEVKAWSEVCEHLAPSGVVTRADGLALRVLVDALSHFLAARESGDDKLRSLCRNDLLRVLGKFGLTPADRTSVSGTAVQANDKERFFGTA